MFQHKYFDNFTFEEVPLNQDWYLMDECYLSEYEKAMLSVFDGGDYQAVGYISYAAARKVNESSIELSWYTNIYERFHEVSISLPRDQFVACVASWQYDEKPHIFVKRPWLENIYLRSYSVFALIDAADFTKALKRGEVTKDKLIKLRAEIDDLSATHLDILFISFADSLLLKSNWSVGYFERGIKYNYKPEVFIDLASKINAIYKATLGLGTYAVIAQGSNEYYDEPLSHFSEFKNHISLNSLGIPFAQLMEIEQTAKKASKEGWHAQAELYMDRQYYNSLNFKYGFDKTAEACYTYDSKMVGTPCKYYYSSISNILANLE